MLGFLGVRSDIEYSGQMCCIEHRSQSDHCILFASRGFRHGNLEQEEDKMHHGNRYLLSSLFLTAALVAPTAMSAATRRQDNGRQEEHRRDDKDRNRFYDRNHKDYHNWDDNEDHSYRLYVGERHRKYRPFAELKEKEQRAYWNWRHSHPDHDRR
jgi:Ni/Co efflux regulator RcnB